MKHKTLKDLEINKPEDSMIQFATGFVKINELKKEAIKWVKEDIEVYRKAELLNGLTAQQGRNIHNFIVDRRRFWKKRFNITEEDLK